MHKKNVDNGAGDILYDEGTLLWDFSVTFSCLWLNISFKSYGSRAICMS